MSMGKVSDGYHTFDELYYHRMILFSVICNQNKRRAWKSKLHADGTMYNNYFIVGIRTDEGDYAYHYHLDNWDYFDVKEVKHSPIWDGHKPEDITRLLTLVPFIESHKNFQKLQEDYNALKKLAINAGLICFRCEGSRKLARYGRKELGEPNLVFSDCDCKVTK